MVDLGFHRLLSILRVKHLFLVMLAITVALLTINSVNFRLVPLWALHLNSDQTAHENQALWCLATHLVGAQAQMDSPVAALIVVRSERDQNCSVVVYGLPTYDTLLNRPESSGHEAFALHKITPLSHAKLPRGTVLAVSAFFWNDSLVVATVSIRNSILPNSSACSYVVSAWDQKTGSVLWERSLAPVPSDLMQASTELNHVQPAILASSICLVIVEKHCGIIFVLLPSRTSESNYHFSTLALSVKTGQILWHHLPGDFGEDSAKAINASALPHWKLRLLAQHEAHLHIGESPWPVYRDAFLKALPVHWYGAANARIQLVPRSSHNVEPRTQNAPDLSKINAVLVTHPQGVDLLDITSGRPLARLPLEWKSGSTYAHMPSINESGLFSHTLTDHSLHQLRITSKIIPTHMSGRAVHVRRDVDADVDSDSMELGQGDFSHQVDCRGLVDRVESSDTSATDPALIGTGGHRVLYAGLCRPSGWWDYARFGRPDWLEDETKAVPPLIVRHSGSAGVLRGLWNSVQLRVRDASLLQSNQLLSPSWYQHAHWEDPDRYDMIFLTSDGSLTSVSNRGHENWHINAEVSWLQVSRTVSAASSPGPHGGSPLDPQLHQLYTKHFRPSLWSTDLVPLNQDFSWHSALFGPQLRWIQPTKRYGSSPTRPYLSSITVLVATGWDSISVVDLTGTGQLLATHRLPCRPTQQPTAARLPYSQSNGFLVDSIFLVPCDGMLLAFGLTSELRLTALLLTVLSLFGTFVALHLFC